ncbi:RES domain-containing protein [Mycobacterium sp. CVI_P3]|uniref:RES domain-containing protein n=1 Tax=Mycobacterium pinniadriaticum TaxID=2994102 RepID=A0ABT3SKV5_9MYCO|nr:RES domain-containing protein [Mycobacterium pinniadriaticum]MCX2933083.1 RES domain-containing protein [Mycobacterium pinniadriaticum]MCX2939505.1 RES domain-containing protein [Mycobacterium pinniadriaticum]
MPARGPWRWCRVYHRSAHTPDGVTFRRYGPLYRLDHHHPADPPADDPAGRRVLYVGQDLVTSACEVFGEAGVAAICPNYRVAVLTPTTALPLFDLTASGAAMAIGALPSLAVGNETRALTQQWAQAIFEDQPAGADVCGVRYRTAYNFGFGLALWDCDDRVVTIGGNGAQDLALNDPRVLRRLQVGLRERRLAVTTIPQSRCPAACERP